MHTLAKPSVRPFVARFDLKLLVTATLFTSLYAAVIGYFSLVDVYDRHFFDSAYSPIYNLVRTLFAAYLFWIVYFSGYVTLRRIAPAGTQSLAPLERLTVGFFVGAALWTFVMLALGYAYLYYPLVAVGLTVPIVLLSSRHLVSTGGDIRDAVSRFYANHSPAAAVMVTASAAVLAYFAILLFLVKGLYPGGAHDYFNQYFYFYTSGIRDHNIWPSSVWYNYFYSKGIGLFFLGMLLTDPLAPSLATCCFVVAASCALFLLVRSIRAETLWPWIAVILFFALYIHTPGYGYGWGQFQKQHELTSAILIAILWTSTKIVNSSGRPRQLWFCACALLAFVVAFIMTVVSGLVGIFLLLTAAACRVVGNRKDAKSMFALAVVAGIGLSLVLVLNYATTGMPLDQGLNWFWPIIDLRRVNGWGNIIDVTSFAHSEIGNWANKIPLFSKEMVSFTKGVAKYDELSGLLVCTSLGLLPFGAILILTRRRIITVGLGRLGHLSFMRRLDPHVFRTSSLVFIFAFASVVFSVLFGASNAESYARLSSFTFPLLIGASAIVWQMTCSMISDSGRIGWASKYFLPIGVALATLCQAFVFHDKHYPMFPSGSQTYSQGLRDEIRAAFRFADGRYSIYGGYKDESGMPGMPPWGGVFPPMLKAWRLTGPETRIWSFDVWSYCMLPGCRPEGMFSFRVSPHTPDVFFGAPDVAKKILQNEGLNYFFLSFSMDDRDYLSCIPLLSPDHIAENVGIKWTDGTSYLLSWLGPGVAPLTPEWLEQYRVYVGKSPWISCNPRSPYLSLGRKVYQQVRDGKHWGFEVPVD